MKKEFQDEFYSKFPQLFDRRTPSNPRGFYGFGCGDGWRHLLLELCTKLVPVVEGEFRVLQVKEKFGTLRFYVYGNNDKSAELINQACIESSKTCEVCGSKTGKLRAERWLRTLCNECHREKRGPE